MRESHIVVVADLHCGHRSGLTPPRYQYGEEEDGAYEKYGKIQKVMWDWYAATIKKLQPIDTLVANGDCIDGKSDRSGGTELITADRKVQCEMASHAIKLAKAKRIYIIKGTPYHTGREEDWEEVLASLVDANHCGYHEWLDAEGVIFDFKHHISNSSVPHGKATALSRAKLWNALWAERELQPKAQVLVRSHRHAFDYTGNATFFALVTPALQAWTKYGSRIVEACPDVGLVSFRCRDGRYSWEPHLLNMNFAAPRSLPA